MATKLEIELTSQLNNDSWTWRAAGARSPKGTVAAGLLYDGAKIGDVARAEVSMGLDGIEVLAVTAPAPKKSADNRIEIIGSSSDDPLVTISGRKKGRSDRPGRGTREGGERSRQGTDRGRQGQGPRSRQGNGERTQRTNDGARTQRTNDGDRTQRTNDRDRPASQDRGARGRPASSDPGRPRPETLKVSIGYRDSFIGEGQMSYAGAGCVARGRLALDIVRERLALTGVAMTEARFELIGVDAVHPGGVEREPGEIRIRVAGRTTSMAEAVRIGNEVETLYTNGPAGGGGATKAAREVIAVVSTLLAQDRVTPVLIHEGS